MTSLPTLSTLPGGRRLGRWPAHHALLGHDPQIDVVADLGRGRQVGGDSEDHRPQLLLPAAVDGRRGQQLPLAHGACGHGAVRQVPGLDVGIGAGMGLNHRKNAVGSKVRPGSDVLGEDVDASGISGRVDRPGPQGHGPGHQHHSPGHTRILPGRTAPTTAGTLRTGQGSTAAR